MKHLLIRTVFLFILVLNIVACSKENVEVGNTVSWINYTEANGLLNDNIHAIAADNLGNIWVTTDICISKFDGIKWTNYIDLFFTQSQAITAIAIDSRGIRWIGSFGRGIAVSNGDRYTYYNHMENSSNSLISDYVRTIYVDSQGNKWIGTDHGLSKFDGINWTNYTTNNGLADNHVYSIVEDKLGNKWIGTNGGVSKFDGTNWTTYNCSGDKPNELAGNGVTSIAIDSKGIWFGTWGGLSEFNGTNWTSHNNETAWLKAGSPVLAIAIDTKGNRWFGTNGWGVSEFDDNNWKTYTDANGSKIQAVNAIAIDSKGNKWFGTPNGLLMLKDNNSR